MHQPALDLVIAALEKIRESHDRVPRASRRLLMELIAVDPAGASLLEVRACPPAATAQQAGSEKATRLGLVRERVCVCTKCAHLASSRTQTVFGVGNPDADLMFIGEAPGA